MIQEKDQYHLLIENLPDGFAYHKMVLDSSGKPLDYVFLEVNSSFETLTGLSRENIIGKKVTEVYSGIKSLGFDWIDIYGKVAATGQSIHFQQYFELAEYWYEITAYSDQPGYFAVVFHDITENKKAEEELRQREKNFFTLVENTPDMVVRFNLDLQHIYCNAAVEHQLGVPVHGFIGKTFLEIDGSPPEQLKSMHQLLQKALETGEEQQTEQSFPLPSGQKYFQTRIVPERDEKGRIESLLAVTRDITKLKQTEETLKKSIQLLRDTGEMAKVGGWELDLSTKEVLWTEEVYRIHGIEPGHKIKLEEALNFYTPESRPALEEALKKVAETGEPYDLESFFIPSGSKDRIWVRSIGRAVYSDGKITKLAGTFQNIDKYKRAEVALQESDKIFKLFMENSPNYVFFKNDKIQAIRLSRNYEKMLGKPMHELLGKTMDDLFPSDLAKSMIADDLRVLNEGKQVTVEEELNGRFYTTIKFPILVKGKPRYLAGYTTDITEHKQAELLILVQRDLSLAISFSHQLDKALSQCLDTMLQLSEMDCGGIYLIDQASGDLNLICHRNLSPAFIKSVSHYKADSTFARLVLQGKPLFTRYSDLFSPDEVNKAEKLLSFAILPLIFEQRVIGCINLASRKLEDVSQLNREMLKTAATLMGEGITRLKIEEELKETNQKLQKAIKNTIQAMALILEKRDPYTAGHQERVAELACAIAEEISLPKDKIEGLYMAGIIHDIGKINVPTEILSKPGRLSEIELSLIQTHPQVGSDILKEMELPGGFSAIVLQHHERMDGSGYPSGLSGDNILLEARILAVADVVEAMASHRPYRPALGIDKALEEISQNKDILYDPKVVDVCLRLFREKGFKFE